MTVQTDAGPNNPVSLGPGDFIRTIRGITWGIKCVNIGGTQWVAVYVRDYLGKWQWACHLDDGFETTTGVAMFDNVWEWFKQRLVPRLNTWLADTFKSTDDSTPAPPLPTTGTPIEQADVLINTRLVVTELPNGSVVASFKS